MPRYKNTPFFNISFCSALVLLIAFTSAIAADGDAPLQRSLTPGMRVRILAPGVAPNKVIGTVEKVSDDSVTLNVPGRNEPVSILREKIARLDVSDGTRSRGVDSAIGAGVGAAVGAAGCALGNGSGQNDVVRISTGAVAGVCAVFRCRPWRIDWRRHSTRRALEGNFRHPLPSYLCASTRPRSRLGGRLEILR